MTSSAKRKLKQKGVLKPRGPQKAVRGGGGRSGKPPITGAATKQRSNDVSPRADIRGILFLVVFPMVMSGVVIYTRDDLREELDNKGLIDMLKGSRIRQAQPSNENKSGKKSDSKDDV